MGSKVSLFDRCRHADDDSGPADAEARDAPDTPAQDGEASPEREMWEATAEPASGAIGDALDARTDDVFPDEAEPNRQHATEGPAAYSEWATVGAGGRDDGEYSLEAFVAAEITLGDWLRDALNPRLQ